MERNWVFGDMTDMLAQSTRKLPLLRTVLVLRASKVLLFKTNELCFISFVTKNILAQTEHFYLLM